jgi:hypothetical protein
MTEHDSLSGHAQKSEGMRRQLIPKVHSYFNVFMYLWIVPALFAIHEDIVLSQQGNLLFDRSHLFFHLA